MQLLLENTSPGSIFGPFCPSLVGLPTDKNCPSESPEIGREIKVFAAVKVVSVKEGNSSSASVGTYLGKIKKYIYILWSDYSLEQLGSPRVPYCACFCLVVALFGLLLPHL